MEFEAASAPGSIPLVRVKEAERVYEREAILGRDAASVFPTETVTNAKAEGLANAVQEGMGAVKFVTESQLEELKAQRGERVEDGTFAADKSLAEVLQANKDAKEEAFQEVWKSMKVGKNRPLDEDEITFYDDLAKQSWRKEREESAADAEQMSAFKLAREQQVVAKAPEPSPAVTASLLAPPPPAAKRKAPVGLRAVVKVVKKDTAASASAAPKPKEEKGGGGALFGLAGYGSDDDSS